MMATDGNRETRAAAPERGQRLRPVPVPTSDEPSDDALLRYIDGAMPSAEIAAFEDHLLRCPHAVARLEILADALAECGWDESVGPPHGKA